LSDVSARMVAAGDTLRIDSLTAHAGTGTLGGSGTIGVLAPGMPVNITLRANNATPLAGGVVTATINANLSIRGEIERQVALGGTIDVRQATIRIPSKLPTSVATIPVRIAGAPPAPPPKPAFAPEIAMALTVRAPEQVFVRGRGLNAELGGTIRIQGTSKQMLPRGAFHLRRGTFNLVGSTLTFSSGEISFNGGSITDPALHLVATSFSGGTTATLTVGGTARNPKVTLSSVPDMPQDQILAQLLFHTNTGQLSPFQIAAIAAGLAELSGSTSNFPNPLEGVQNALGLDQLGIGSGANGAPTLQAGRYIGRRLYVGAQESTAGGSQGTVQYNLTQGLKLNASVGAGQTTSAIGTTGESNGASVGITYQFQY
ncbi:MAG TPA: translocation/assembly module TamB domain-containing protein, partial [Acetobacteraceae bacterium]|nr:translocation/assembly module TamB domain-containing protein [Acetobacteraceae bacterium]